MVKVAAASQVLTITDSDDEVSLSASVVNSAFSIRRVLTENYVEVAGAFGIIRITTANVSHLNGSSFSGTTQDIVDALVTGLAAP